MQWHQPWLLGLDQEQLEDLHSDARGLAKSHQRRGNWGLTSAWLGLAHEALERSMELCKSSSAPADGVRQTELEMEPYSGGAYRVD